MLAERPRTRYEGAQLDNEIQTSEPLYTIEEIGQLAGKFAMILLVGNTMPTGTPIPEGELATLEATLATVQTAERKFQ
jgi:hypothetical protein